VHCSDSWRKLGGPVCDNGRLIRQELLDQIVWAEVIRLLEDPALIQQELDRRLVAARTSDPTRKREQSLQRELNPGWQRYRTTSHRIQEGLLSIEQLRETHAWTASASNRHSVLELQAIADQINDRAAFLRLAETLTAFLARLRSAAETLSVIERQKIVRLLVKTFWSPRIPLPFVTAFRFLHLRPKREDQRPPKIQITFCVRGVISPLLANIYLHYAFDLWRTSGARNGRKAKWWLSATRTTSS